MSDHEKFDEASMTAFSLLCVNGPILSLEVIRKEELEEGRKVNMSGPFVSMYVRKKLK